MGSGIFLRVFASTDTWIVFITAAQALLVLIKREITTKDDSLICSIDSWISIVSPRNRGILKADSARAIGIRYLLPRIIAAKLIPADSRKDSKAS